MGFKGSVGTDEKCPVCKKKFELISIDQGFFCPEHLTHPKRFWISCKALGIKNKLYSDRLGNIFDSYQAVINQWTAMNVAYREAKNPKGKKFNPDAWITAKVREQLFQHKAAEFIETKRILYDRNKLSKSRWQHTNTIISIFLNPFFAAKDIRDIDKKEIKIFYIALLDMRMGDKTPYSDSYIKDILDMLKSILIEFRGEDIPAFPEHTVVLKKEKQWLGMERQMAIEPQVKDKYRLAIRVLQATGMRQGEVRALQVNDMIDGSLKVWKAFGDKGLKLKRKNGGEVSYSIPLDLWNDLQEYTKGKSPDDFIFTHEDGTPLGRGRLYKEWRAACSKAEVKYIPLQQASRHSMASQIMAEAKKKAIDKIQAKLGHFNKTTQKHYVIE